MYSKGRRKSFWKLKLGNSPRSRNFIDSWRKLSTTKMDTSSLLLQPAYSGTRVVGVHEDRVSTGNGDYTRLHTTHTKHVQNTCVSEYIHTYVCSV